MPISHLNSSMNRLVLRISVRKVSSIRCRCSRSSRTVSARTPLISGCWAISTKISSMANGVRLNTFGLAASI
ncbi:hypothetical protein D3C79_958870 [compost metagenome]